MIPETQYYEPKGNIESQIIKCIWKLSDDHADERTELILPKGTAEIIFNFSNHVIYQSSLNNIGITLPDSFINGINLKPFKLIKKGRQEFLGIQLNDIGLKLLFDIPANDFNNKVYESALIDRTLNSMASELHSKTNFGDQVQTILKWIRKRVSNLEGHKYQERLYTLQNACQIKDVKVADLSKKCFLSDRQMHRFCLEWFGMNPATYLKYQKYLCALKLVHKTQNTLTQVGTQAGYYDQSHFMTEFKSFANISPKNYKQAIKGIPGHIFL
ncbi:MAG: helix-turn-helix transcriptional regulator [Saprospiraceae bacterium]|nr:helix-turn-helix transcriptional regulator [Saprospiraceae bacterium]